MRATGDDTVPGVGDAGPTGLGETGVSEAGIGETPGAAAAPGHADTECGLDAAHLVRRGARHLADADATTAFGEALASLLRRGDVIVMTGDLGAGKTTMTRGLGAALGVRGDVTSPTFVIAREHPPLGDGPALVHVDAYRLGGFGELDDLDLDTSLDEAVTVVEWGAGMAEGLSEDRMHLTLTGLDDRTVTIETSGTRWTDVDLVGELGLDRP